MKTISRSEARARKLTRYYTGEPCRRGHDAQRLVSNCLCVECERLRYQRRYWLGRARSVCDYLCPLTELHQAD